LKYIGSVVTKMIVYAYVLLREVIISVFAVREGSQPFTLHPHMVSIIRSVNAYCLTHTHTHTHCTNPNHKDKVPRDKDSPFFPPFLFYRNF